ncbi:MAG: hypothetical protein KDA45_16310, partial [Planctomycetales bacterium]|nr:hypothetical protein [Planctomycetales bacterium]
ELTLTELDFKTRQEVPREPFAEGGKNTASAPPGSGEPAEKTNDALKPTLPEVLPQDLPSASPTSSLENSSEFRQPMLGGTLVVSDERPSDVDPKLWVETLTEALLRTAARSDLQEIEIRGRQVLHGPLHFQRHHLRIRGGSRTATLQLSEQALLAHDQGEGIFDLQDSQLTLAGLSLEVTLPLDVPLAMEGLFYVAGNSQLELDNCLVTINDRSQANGFFVVRCGGPSEPSNPPSAVPLSGLNDASPTLSDAMLIRLDTSVVRGETNFLSWEVTAETLNERLDISLNDTLLAISGSVLKLKSPTGDSQAQRFARLLCSQSTFVSEQPFAQLEYEGNAAPLLGLMRTSQSCIYWSRPQVPHVRISGARRQSLLGNFNLLLLQGVNNLYDANIEDVCQGFLGAERMVTFGFAEAYSSGWLGERGNEARVRWQSPPVPQLPLHDARPADFAVSDVLFVPGITPGNLPRPTF